MKQYQVVKNTRVTPFQKFCDNSYAYYNVMLTIIDWNFTEDDIIAIIPIMTELNYDNWYIRLPISPDSPGLTGFTVNSTSIIEL